MRTTADAENQSLRKPQINQNQNTLRTDEAIAWYLLAFSTDWNLNQTNSNNNIVYKYIRPLLSWDCCSRNVESLSK